MEKKRRDRINVALASLSSILVETGCTHCHESSPHSSVHSSASPSTFTAAEKKKARMDKADILEKVVKNMRRIVEAKKKAAEANFQASLNDLSELSLENQENFITGYRSCMQLTKSILGNSKQDYDESVVSGLNAHLEKKLDQVLLEEISETKLSTSEVCTGYEDPLVNKEDAAVDVDECISFIFLPKRLEDGTFALVAQPKEAEDSKLNSSKLPLVKTGLGDSKFKPLPKMKKKCYTDDEGMDMFTGAEGPWDFEDLHDYEDIDIGNEEEDDDVWRPWG